MNESRMPTEVVHTQKESGMVKGLVIVLLAAVGVLGWSSIQFQKRLNRLDDAFQKSYAKTSDAILTNSGVTEKALNELRESIDEATAVSAAAAGKTKAVVEARAHELAQRLSKEQARLEAELGKVRSDAGTTSEKLTTVSNDVESTKTELAKTSTDLAKTSTDLAKTTTDLRSVMGDLGVQSGLIATNGKELAALRALGDRNYHEFELSGTKTPTKVGQIMVRLKKADAKRNRFTLEIIADDRVVEKRDRNTNEPIQFYVAKSTRPYEIVINEVGKNRVTGYLSTPTVLQSQR